MKRQFIIAMSAAVIAFFISFSAEGQVLKSIETYKSPPPPFNGFSETYDNRIQSGNPVPPSLTDVLVCDVWQRVTMDLKLTMPAGEIDDKIIASALEVYSSKQWSEIAGLRPWTHWNFINDLPSKKRTTLATEIVSYIKEHGTTKCE